MKRFICLIITLLLICSAASCGLISPKQAEIAANKAKLSVHFIDVGQGDSALLESDGEFVLIDAGEATYGTTVLDFIKSRDARSIKYMIATHPHSDHIGGLRTVMDGVRTENFITVETDSDTSSWINTLKKVEAMGINYIDAVPGDQYSFGSATLTVVGPVKYDYEGYNNCSVVVKAECGDISFLLTGDAEQQAEFDMLDSGADLSADVLKCGHHGSSDASSAALLKAVEPVFAVASCAKNNEYGHPNEETVERLRLLGAELFRTDTQGTISFYTDGSYLTAAAGGARIGSYNAGEDRVHPENLDFIGNKNSMLFHDPTCSGGKATMDKNKVTFKNRKDAIAQGYSPCPHCKP